MIDQLESLKHMKPRCFGQSSSRRGSVVDVLPVAMDAVNVKLPLSEDQRGLLSVDYRLSEEPGE
jgi:hypothetical protein